MDYYSGDDEGLNNNGGSDYYVVDHVTQQDSQGGTPLMARKISVYKPAKGDQVDEAMAQILNRLDLNSIPVIRISNGKYLIGTESKMVVLKNSSCMVRVGGGFEKMEEYISKHQDAELDKIRRNMNDNNKSYDEVVMELLIKYGAD